MEANKATQDYKEKKKAWIENNPLRVWRKTQYLTQNDIAVTIGVGYHMIHSWEAGATAPTEAQLDALADVMKAKDLSKKWDDWKNEMPIYGN